MPGYTKNPKTNPPPPPLFDTTSNGIDVKAGINGSSRGSSASAVSQKDLKRNFIARVK